MELMAHRGASGIAPENTLAAFRLALEHHSGSIELDVHSTADGEVVVMHDATVDRTTNGTGAIAEMTLAELRRLDAGAWHSEQFAGERIPRLEEVVELVGNRARLNVEVKGGSDVQVTAARVVDIFRAGGILAASEISSFALTAVLTVQQLTSEPELALITGHAVDLGTAIDHRLDWLNLAYPEVTADLVAQAHAAGVRVTAWTINDLSRWDEFESMGVDAFCTNNPHLFAGNLTD